RTSAAPSSAPWCHQRLRVAISTPLFSDRNPSRQTPQRRWATDHLSRPVPAPGLLQPAANGLGQERPRGRARLSGTEGSGAVARTLAPTPWREDRGAAARAQEPLNCPVGMPYCVTLRCRVL